MIENGFSKVIDRENDLPILVATDYGNEMENHISTLEEILYHDFPDCFGKEKVTMEQSIDHNLSHIFDLSRCSIEIIENQRGIVEKFFISQKKNAAAWKNLSFDRLPIAVGICGSVGRLEGSMNNGSDFDFFVIVDFDEMIKLLKISEKELKQDLRKLVAQLTEPDKSFQAKYKDLPIQQRKYQNLLDGKSSPFHCWFDVSEIFEKINIDEKIYFIRRFSIANECMAVWDDNFFLKKIQVKLIRQISEDLASQYNFFNELKNQGSIIRLSHEFPFENKNDDSCNLTKCLCIRPTHISISALASYLSFLYPKNLIIIKRYPDCNKYEEPELMLWSMLTIMNAPPIGKFIYFWKSLKYINSPLNKIRKNQKSEFIHLVVHYIEFLNNYKRPFPNKTHELINDAKNRRVISLIDEMKFNLLKFCHKVDTLNGQESYKILHLVEWSY